MTDRFENWLRNFKLDLFLLNWKDGRCCSVVMSLFTICEGLSYISNHAKGKRKKKRRKGKREREREERKGRALTLFYQDIRNELVN